MGFETFIFDVDGTLVNSYLTSYYAKEKALQDLQIPYTKEQIDAGFSLTSKESLELFDIELDSELGKQLIEKEASYFNDYLPLTVLFPNMESVLKKLKKNNKNLAIVTSRIKKEVETEKVLQPILKYFDIIITASDIKCPKPNPESLQLLFSKTSWNKEKAIFIGDSFNDSKCASNYGIPFGLAKWGALEEVPCDFVIHDVIDITSL